MSASKPQFDVLGLGSASVDDFLYVDAFPACDSKCEVRESGRQCGGLTATALVAAARLGARCAYAGVLGNDELSKFVLDTLKREGIDVSHARRRKGARPVHSRIVVDRHRGTRNIFFDLAGVTGAGDTLSSTELVSKSRVLFVDSVGVPGMLRAARAARSRGTPVVADFDASSHVQFPELLATVDHLIISRGFGSELTRESQPEKMIRKLAPGREIVAVTDGERGCWFANGSGRVRHQPAFKVTAVDTTGCGDVFHGAYAFALARKLPVEQRFELASAAAALKATMPGGQSGIPTLKAVNAFLKQ